MLYFAENSQLGLSKEDIKDYRVVDAMAAAVSSSSQRGLEHEISDNFAEKLPETIRRPGEFWIPPEVLFNGWQEQLDLTVTGAGDTSDLTKGSVLVSKELLTDQFVRYLFNSSVFLPRVPSLFGNEIGNITIPKASQGAMLAEWLGEATNKDVDDDPAFSLIELSPKRISAQTNFTWKLERNAELYIEGYVRALIASTIAQAIDAAYLYGAGGDKQINGHEAATPTGQKTTYSVAAGNLRDLTYNDLVELPSRVNRYANQTEDRALNYSFIAPWKAWRDLLVSPRFGPKDAPVDGSPYKNMWGSSYTSINVAGLPMIFSNQAKARYVHLLDFSNVLTKYWAGLSVTVDPYSMASTGTTRVICDLWMDADWRYPETLSLSVGTA